MNRGVIRLLEVTFLDSSICYTKCIKMFVAPDTLLLVLQ